MANISHKLKYMRNLIFLILLLAGFYIFITVVFFPNKINILQGDSQSFIFKLPFTVTSEGESVAVLNVGHKPLSENINIDNEFTIDANQVGSAEITLNAFGVPVKKVKVEILPDMEIIPSGLTVGVRINTDGVLVLGTGAVSDEDGKTNNPCAGVLRSGDLIMSANGIDLSSKEDLIKVVAESEDEVVFKIKRNDEIIEEKVKPVKGKDEKANQLGIWVRDSTQGIGTITYYNPKTNKFAALGHGILDIDTKQLMGIKNGKIMPAEVFNIKEGKKGSPGELVGNIDTSKKIGEIKSNTNFGVFGELEELESEISKGEVMKVALQDSVYVGPATIKSNVERNEVNEYDIYIEKVNKYTSDETKGMVIKITDPRLLSKTNGIVQGMSGSPIIQDGKLIGAITHVFVQDPTKGYGIFIETMLEHESAV